LGEILEQLWHGSFPASRTHNGTAASPSQVNLGHEATAEIPVPSNATERVAVHSRKLRKAVVGFVLVLLLAACTRRENPEDLKERTAQATENVKRDAKAVAEGIRQGWSRDKPLDLNTATREQLLSLPGMSSSDADGIIAGRPYSSPNELLARRIVSQADYDQFADRVTAKR